MDAKNTSSVKRLAWIPEIVRAPLVKVVGRYRKFRQQLQFRKALHTQPVKRIIVGAETTQFDGWIPTNKEALNLLDESAWRSCLKPDSLDAILAEHVWEHLSSEEAVAAARHCFKYLKPGGHLRVAVPDGLHPDPDYIDWVRPGGKGSGSDDHKVLYTYDTFMKVFIAAGFDVSLCEYFDERGEFHSIDWDPEQGMIRRSKRFDKATIDRSKSGIRFDYTSIILDAIKPVDVQS